MANTNMDHKSNPNATVPIMEFSIPKPEFDSMVALNDMGELCIPVQVIEVSKDRISFRKIGPAKAMGEFKEESLEKMKERMGTVEDEEEKMHKEDK